MSKKKLKRLKIVCFVLLFILFLEIFYVGYSLMHTKEESVYFDGINAVVSNDNYYATVGSNNDNDNHFEKAKVTYYNTKKEKTFENLYNAGYNSAFFGVLLDESDVIAVGSYEKTKSDHDDSIRRALIVKYDSEGNIIFEKDFKLLDNSKFTSIIKVGDYYYVTGQTVYKSTKIGSKDGGGLLIKYDKDGNLIWSRTYGSSKSGIFNDLIYYNDNIYVVGNGDNYIGALVEYDLDGNQLDYNDYKYTDETGFSGIVAVNNKIYISGSNRSANDDTSAMIVMYTLNCRYIKEVTYNDGGAERFNKLLVDDDENIIGIGTMYFSRKGNHNTVDEYNYNGIIGKYDLDLNQIKVNKYGDDRDDYFTDIVYRDNKYIVVGYSSYEDGSYMSKFINYTKALKLLEVE